MLDRFLMTMATQYGVDPFILTTIHLSSTPVMFAALAWIVRNGRVGRSILVPSIFAVASYLSSYIYLAVCGHGLPIWVWGVAATVITVCGTGTILRTRSKMAV